MKTTRVREGRFTGHDKRVTLNLGRLSAVCAEKPELLEVLNKLPAVDYNLDKLPQADVERIYVEFDEALENRIRGEFYADPDFIVDLEVPSGTCPLCGHTGCRFIFRLQNQVNENVIECGSECIITYAISVKGAETAGAARKALERAIRRAIRKVWIRKWHEATGFKAEHFAIASSVIADWLERSILPSECWARQEARRCLNVELPRLEKFYARYGWLNTKHRWGRWLGVVATANTFSLPSYPAWTPRPKRSRSAPVVVVQEKEASETSETPVVPQGPVVDGPVEYTLEV